MLAAGQRGSEAAEDALARLCSLYWYPIFAFVRRQGHPADEAQDLTQGFFTRIIEKGDLGDADRSRGRFRSFLLTACQHFLSNEGDRARALKRGGRAASHLHGRRGRRRPLRALPGALGDPRAPL